MVGKLCKFKIWVNWESLCDMVLLLNLLWVELMIFWGELCFKVYGKNWVWWSFYEDVFVFKVFFEEWEVLVDVDFDMFFFIDYYKSYFLIFVRFDKFDFEWVKNNFIKVWCV